MEDIKLIIGENLAELRKERKLTQLELAELFGYTDKAISKWEKGDTLPDVETLYKLCNFYDVTLDYLTTKDDKNKKEFTKKNMKAKMRNNIISSAMMITIVWMLATIVYVYLLITQGIGFWICFIWALPTTALALLFTNRYFFHKKIVDFIALSIFIWTLILSFYLQFIEFNIWPLFLIGVPSEIILILWANFIKIKK